MGGREEPPPDAAGYLWFLRLTAVVAIPLYGMATVVGPAAEAGIVALVALIAASAIVVALRLPQGRTQYAVVATILVVLTALLAWASLR